MASFFNFRPQPRDLRVLGGDNVFKFINRSHPWMEDEPRFALFVSPALAHSPLSSATWPRFRAAMASAIVSAVLAHASDTSPPQAVRLKSSRFACSKRRAIASHSSSAAARVDASASGAYRKLPNWSL